MLNVSKGDMYPWITHTWNTIKGECPHGCAYCYMRRFGKQRPVHFDAKELKTDLGEGNFIFVGSSCDMFAEAIPSEWIQNTLIRMTGQDNRYLLQTKNPARIHRFAHDFFRRPMTICTTIETNRIYPEIMGDTPTPFNRSAAMGLIGYPKYVTIEPIMDFDLAPLVKLVKRCEPEQVNIGADSGGNGLPEPPADNVLTLISELKAFTRVKLKPNLKRLLPGNASLFED